MKTVIVTAGVITDHGKVLVAQRRQGCPQALLWEFPGGKVKEREEPRQALQRELKEELDVDVSVGTILEAVFHPYPDEPVLLLAYYCRIEKGLLKPLECHEVRWVDLNELKGLAMPPADDPIRNRLCSSNIVK